MGCGFFLVILLLLAGSHSGVYIGGVFAGWVDGWTGGRAVGRMETLRKEGGTDVTLNWTRYIPREETEDSLVYFPLLDPSLPVLCLFVYRLSVCPLSVCLSV